MWRKNFKRRRCEPSFLVKLNGFYRRVMIPAYDDPIIWEGHGSMVHEMQKQLGRKPDAIFCSVGGGGMLGGILVGCKAIGWDNGGYLHST